MLSKGEHSMITTTKRVEFCYGHFLPDYDGKCKRLHGHNAVLEVTVKRGMNGYLSGGVFGEKEEHYPGMVLDFGILKAAMKEVTEQLDHYTLNNIEGFPSPPTAENMVKWIAVELQQCMPRPVKVVEVRVSETPDSWATWTDKCNCG